MINKKIEEIKEADLQALVDNKVLESKVIEYKRDLPDNSDSAKKEFLADVTSFANSSGGDLIFGISQDNQTAELKAIEGIEIENIDKERIRLNDIIMTGVEPRLLSVAIQPIPLSNSKYAILIRIPKSWISPHRAIYKGHNKFHARDSSGKKHEMDVDELRIAFNLTETLTDKIRKFKVDRVAKILADETPIPLYQNPKIVLHLIPINSFNPSQKYDIDCITSHPEKIIPINSNGCNWRFNLDGFLTYSSVLDNKFYSYVQLYRNGIIEAVEGFLLGPMEELPPIKERLIIPSIDFESKLPYALNLYFKVLHELRVDPPIFVFLSLLGVKGYKMGTNAPFGRYTQHPIDRDLLLLPEAVVENYEIRAEDAMRPLFDLIWNACGFQRSLNFDENGNWIKR